MEREYKSRQLKITSHSVPNPTGSGPATITVFHPTVNGEKVPQALLDEHFRFCVTEEQGMTALMKLVDDGLLL